MFPLGKFRATHFASNYLRLNAVEVIYGQLPRFLLINAPAGYGKSSLAIDVMHYWESRSFIGTWLSLDKADSNVGRFLSLLAVGFSKLLDSTVDPSSTSNPYYKSDIEQLTDSCVRRLNLIEAEGAPFVLVLDDYHEVQSAALNRAFDALLAYWPENLSLIITSRTPCKLKLSKHVLSGACVQVGLDDLKFDQQHIKQLAMEQEYLGKQELPEQWLKQVLAVTEGWPVAVQLACYQLKNGTQIELDDAQYRNDVADFFWEQVFEDLPEAHQTLLVACAFVERFDSSLLVAITENANLPTVLAELLISNMFLLPVKGQANWYRIHSTLRSLLYGRFLLLNYDQQQRYVENAINWFSNQGYLDESLNLCQQYELWSKAANILRVKGDDYISTGSFEFLHYWFEKLSDDVISSDPMLIVYNVWSMPEYRQIHAGNMWLDRAETIINATFDAEGKQTIGYINSLKVLTQILALRGYVARISGCYDDAVSHSEEAVELAMKVYPAILSRLYMTLGQDYYLHGDLVASELAIQKSIQLGKKYKQSHNVLIALGYLIATLVLAGRFRDALSQYVQCKQWFDETGFSELPQAGLLRDLSNDLYREMGEFDNAKNGVLAMEEFCKVAPTGLPHLVSNIRRFRLSIAVNDKTQAKIALVEAELFKKLLGVSWSFGWAPVEAMRAQYELRWGAISKADDWFLPRSEKLFEANGFADECEQFLYAEWLIAKGDVERARTMLDRIACHAMANRRMLHLVKVKVQQAMLMESTDPVQSELLLMEALKCAGDELILGPFLEAGKGILPILERVKSRMYQDFDALKLLEKLNNVATALWPSVDVQLDSYRLKSLSNRQFTILKLLVEGAQDKAIAKELDISPGTVKTHLRTIYRKLGCNNRSLAVSIALEEGIQFLEGNELRVS